MTYSCLANRPRLGQQMLEMGDSIMRDPAVSPLQRVWWQSRLSLWLCVRGQFDDVHRCLERADQIMRAHGLTGLTGARITLAAHRQWAMLGMRNWSRAKALGEEMTAFARASHTSEQWQATQASLRFSLCRGDSHAALRIGPECVRLAQHTGMIYLEVLANMYYIEALAESGRFDEALERLAHCNEITRATCLDYYESEIKLIEAYIAHARGDRSRCRELLKKCFSLAVQRDALWCFSGCAN